MGTLLPFAIALLLPAIAGGSSNSTVLRVEAFIDGVPYTIRFGLNDDAALLSRQFCERFGLLGSRGAMARQIAARQCAARCPLNAGEDNLWSSSCQSRAFVGDPSGCAATRTFLVAVH